MITASRLPRGTRRTSALLALALPFVSALQLHAQPTSAAAAQPAKDPAQPEKMQAFEVTGSRIKRLDVEGPSPVIAITRQDIEVTGFQTVGDLIRSLPFSNGTSVDPQFGSGFASGATSLNLRGLGSNNSLILVNGRRAAPYGFPGGSGFTTLFDFNSIPLASIETVEILKDGASAIYGSDAVAGVVNIKLRENYSGFSTSAMYGNTFESDSSLRNFNLTYGANSGKTSILFTADWQSRNAMFLNDRDISKSSDGRALGGQDGRSSTGFPGAVNVPTRDAAGRTPPAGTITGTNISPQGNLLTSPRASDFAAGVSPYDFNGQVTMIPDYTYAGIYTRAKHEINDNLYAFAEVSLRQNNTHYEQAATPVTSTSEQGSAPAGGLLLPYNNPYNPFGVDITSFSFRMIPLGRRTRDVESTTTRYLAGLGGNVGLSDWTFQGALLYAQNTTVGNDGNQATDAALQRLLSGTTLATAINPFGPSAAGLVESLRTTLNRKSTTDVRSGDLQASGTVWTLPAGNMGLAVGAEYRKESIKDKPDAFAATGGVVALGGSSGVTGYRDVKAVYAELSIPLLRSVEVQLAGRHEEYSDFGKSDKPKIGAKWRPTKWLVFRGAFGQSFRAPDLTQLFTSQSISFSSQPLRDPLRPNDPVAQIRQISGGNPLLQPEETNSYYFGTLIEVPQVKGLEFSVDLWRFMRSDEISTNSLNFILSQETTTPTGLVVRNAPTGDGLPGTINAVNLAFVNISKTRTEGVDVAVRYTHTTELGKFTYNVAATHTHSYQFNFVEFIRTNGFPQLRGSASVQWQKGHWGASVHGTYLDGYAEPAASVFGPGKPGAHRIGNHYLVNPQVSYSGLWGTKITVGVNNVFNRNPPYAFNRSEQYDLLQVSNEGRFGFVRVSKEF
jgi:outer membrane receptor protein involved in Fe transport